MKKKILFVHPSLAVGGAETVLISYLNILSKYSDKYEVNIVFIETRYTNFEKIPNNIATHFVLSDIETEFLAYILSASPEQTAMQDYFRSWIDKIRDITNSRLLKIINTYNPDVIIDFLFGGSSFQYFINKYDLAERIISLRWIHSSAEIDYDYLGDPNFYSHILNKYSALVTICQDMQQSCKKALDKLGIGHKKVYSIFNPVDFDSILNHLTLDFEIESDEQRIAVPFILQVARLEENQKNHLEMIEIYARLKKRGVKEKLYIIGDGSNRQKLQTKIDELGLNEDCLLLGRRMNPFIFMKHAKLFLHTANYEGLPTVFIESMICGTPVIAYDCPTGPKEILENGKYGALIPMGEQDLFVETAYELLTNESKLNHYKQLLPEAVQRFSFDTIGQQFLDLLDNEFKEKEIII